MAHFGAALLGTPFRDPRRAAQGGPAAPYDPDRERRPDYDSGGYGAEGHGGYGREGYEGYRGREHGPGREGYGDPYDDRGYGPPGAARSYPEAWMVPGPQTGRGPRNYRRSDERILEDACERLTQHGQLDASDIEVEVRDGEVTLRGTVGDRRSKRMAEDSIESVPGVRDVHNQLRLSERPAGMGGLGEPGREEPAAAPE